jgi:NADH-quinone oxidoreductase subunit C
MTTTLETLRANLSAALGTRLQSMTQSFGELTIAVHLDDYLEVARCLRDDLSLRFEQLIDLCGVDYSAYGVGGDQESYKGPRFACVLHLLSLAHNWRLRLKVFVSDKAMPILPSVVEIWNSANWYEREAFDLFGLVFDGHPDLRRILTDYGFIGHPFRKDFPVSGYVEMRYDAQAARVIYQPITIEPREMVPRVIREAHYGRD